MKELGNKVTKQCSQYFNNEGFTLIEVVVSIVLIGVIVSIFSILFLDSIKIIGTSGDRDRALNKARDRMNQLIVSEADNNDTITIRFYDNDGMNPTILSIPGEVLETQPVKYKKINKYGYITLSYFKAVIQE